MGAEIDSLLEAVDPQNNQRITYSEIVQVLSQHTAPCYPNNEITVAIVTLEAVQMPILEKFVTFAPYNGHSMLNDDVSGYQQESISAMMNDGEASSMCGGLTMLGTNEHEINRRLSEVNQDHHQEDASSANSSEIKADD